jgi:hypothetical protein
MIEKQSVSRREILVGALSSLAAIRSAGGAQPTARKANFRFGLATYEWGKDWDIPTILKNLTAAKVYSVELKTVITRRDGTPLRYPHGVELDLPPYARVEVKKRFADSPVDLVSLATSEHFPYSDGSTDMATVDGFRLFQEKYGKVPDNGITNTRASIEAVKAYLQLSHDVGSRFVRVLPNNWLPDFPHERTLDMIADNLNEVAPVARDLGQQIALEAHGAPGTLQNMKYVMDRVKDKKAVGIRLNSEVRNTVDPGFEEQYAPIADVVSPTMHIHNLKSPAYPYQLVLNVMAKAGFDGWALLEVSDRVPDRVAALAEQREIWEQMVAAALRVS